MVAMAKTDVDEREFKKHAKSKKLFRQCEASCKIMQGRELIKVKSEMPYGTFGKWIVLELQISQRTAQRLMKLAHEADSRELNGIERHEVVLSLGDAAMDIHRGIDPFPDEKTNEKPRLLRARSDSQSQVVLSSALEETVECKQLSPVNRISEYLQPAEIVEVKDEPCSVCAMAAMESVDAVVSGEVLESLVPSEGSKFDQFKRLVDSMDESERNKSIDWYNGVYGTPFVLGRTAVEEATDAVKACSVDEQETIVGVMIAEWNSKALQRLAKKCVTARKSRKELYTEDFEAFWQAFPSRRRTAKGNAMQAWDRAMALLESVPPPVGYDHWSDYVTKRASDYAKSSVASTEYVKGPESWLNGRCWDDSPNAWKSGVQQYGYFDHELESRDADRAESPIMRPYRKVVTQKQ